MKPRLKSTHYEEVKNSLLTAINAGIETWNIDLLFEPDGVSLNSITNTTKDILNY